MEVMLVSDYHVTCSFCCGLYNSIDDGGSDTVRKKIISRKVRKKMRTTGHAEGCSKVYTSTSLIFSVTSVILSRTSWILGLASVSSWTSKIFGSIAEDVDEDAGASGSAIVPGFLPRKPVFRKQYIRH